MARTRQRFERRMLVGVRVARRALECHEGSIMARLRLVPVLVVVRPPRVVRVLVLVREVSVHEPMREPERGSRQTPDQGDHEG